MKVILAADVKNLGKKGDTVEVAEGYARNFLIPRGLVTEASAGALRNLQEQKKAQQAREDRVTKEAQGLADKLKETTVTLRARVGEGGKLFGSITAKDVADAAAQAVGKPVDKKLIELKEPIRSLGMHTVVLNLGHQIKAEVKVHVIEA